MPGRFDRLERVGADLDDRAVRIALLEHLRATVTFDAHAWVMTDPESEVGASPLADVPRLDVLPLLIRAKYLTTANRWTSLAAGAAAGLPAAPSPLGDVVRDEGMVDVASTVCRDAHGCWAFLDIWRRHRRFTLEEVALVGNFGRAATPILRRALAATFPAAPAEPPVTEGPAVLMLTDELRVVTRTPATDGHLRALLPGGGDRPPVPAAVYNVAAQLLAVEAGVDDHPAVARVHLRAGLWVTLRAARLVGAAGHPTIAVTIEATPALDRCGLYARVHGLTPREAELLRHLAGGVDSRELARRMFVSEHTVQDHLKAIFAKSGVKTRRQLVARATGT